MYLKVKVFAKSKKESLLETKENYFEVRVKEKAERNLANNRVLELIAEHFEINKKEVKIVNGHHHPIKLLSIKDDY